MSKTELTLFPQVQTASSCWWTCHQHLAHWTPPPDYLTQQVLSAKHMNSSKSCHSLKFSRWLRLTASPLTRHSPTRLIFDNGNLLFNIYLRFLGEKVTRPTANSMTWMHVFDWCSHDHICDVTAPARTQFGWRTQAREARKFGKRSILKRWLKTCLCCLEKIQILIYYCKQSLRVLVNTSLMLDEWITSVLKNAIFQLLLDGKYLSFFLP